MTVTPDVPSREPSRVVGGSVASSTTMTTWGQGDMGPRASNAGLVVTSGPSRSARSAASVTIIRAGPKASDTSLERACGSHFIHSHDGRAASLQSTAMRKAVGGMNIARCATIARTCARPCSGSAPTSTWEKLPKAIPKGMSSTSRCVATNRWTAEKQTGSGFANGGSSGSSKTIERSWVEEPSRIVRASPSEASLSQRRLRSSATRTSARGSGMCHDVNRRCCDAAVRAVFRSSAR